MRRRNTRAMQWFATRLNVTYWCWLQNTRHSTTTQTSAKYVVKDQTIKHHVKKHGVLCLAIETLNCVCYYILALVRGVVQW